MTSTSDPVLTSFPHVPAETRSLERWPLDFLAAPREEGAGVPSSRLAGTFVVTGVAASLACGVNGSWARPQTVRGAERPWPCRLIVKPSLLGVVEDGWRRSATLRRQCSELADAGAVVALEWGKSDSQTRAATQFGTAADGVVVANVSVPPVSEAIELVAHELEHVLERTRGLNLAIESRRPGSGVWKAFGGFETQRAIDTGRQVATEVEDNRRDEHRGRR